MDIRCETCRYISLKRWLIKGEGKGEKATKAMIGPAWPGTGTCTLFWKAVMLNASELCWKPKPDREDGDAPSVPDLAYRKAEADDPWSVAIRRKFASAAVSEDNPVGLELIAEGNPEGR